MADGQVVKRETALDMMREHEKAIQKALSDAIPFEYFMAAAFSAIRRDSKLKQCSPVSVLSSLMVAAQCGLAPHTPLGHFYLVPYKKEATPIIGYKGYVAMAYREPRIGSVHAHVVYEADEFDVQYGTSESIHHSPAPGDRGKKVGAYAGFFIDGRHPVFRYLPEDEILRARPPHWQKTPWNDEKAVAEMWAKTPLRRIMKMAPLSTQLALGIAADEATSRGARVRWTPEEGTFVEEDGAGDMPEAATAGGLSGNDANDAKDGEEESHDGKGACYLCGKFFAPDELDDVDGKMFCKPCQKET